VITRSPINRYMFVVSLLGWFGVFLSLFWSKPFNYLLIIGLLVILLLICEISPISSERGMLTFSFPIVYTIYIIQGILFTVFTFAIVILLISLLRERPFKDAAFNAGYRSFSFTFALLITDLCFKAFFELPSMEIFHQTLYIFMVTGIYFFIKCNLYELYIKFKGAASPLNWWKKYIGAFIVFLFSFFYCWLMFFLGNQDRGRTDAFSFFFFFAPLIALTIVSAIIAKLEREKRRLNMLFAITNEFKQGIATANVATKIIEQIRDFLPIDSTILWIKENNSWKISHQFGEINTRVSIDGNIQNWLNTITEAIYVPNQGQSEILGMENFDDKNQSFIFAPLFIENELIGVWGIGSYNAFAFQKDDLLSIKALANQIAIIVRTRKLIQEQENHRILEERNRIAREIHDGIAQRVAGAVMNLEAANKSFDASRLDESKKLVQESLVKLRGSLKDIRQSIYALRPHPTQQVGIVQALQDLIGSFELENQKAEIDFQIKGSEISLGYLVENTLFNVLKEALRNIQKHANATAINIMLNFKETEVLLRVKDNGSGFSLMDAMIKAKAEPHFGIINMQELADNMGATLDISAKKGLGTEITLVVPKITEEAGDNHDKRHVGG
jgi:signal transduction histidine kinase